MQIEFKSVTKEYEEGFKALNNITFSIENGEFIYIIGESGAGKTTLVKMLTREELPTEGEIFVDSVDISSLVGDELSMLRRKVGVVFQDFKLLESRTVFDNVAIALEVSGSDDEEINSVVPSVLSLVNLGSKIYSMPSTLSGGEKQRLSIARALAHEPDVLVADEPTGMIDPKSADEVMAVLEKINSLGTTIMMATHNKELVDSTQRRVLKLEKGTLVSDKRKGSYAG